MSNQYSSFDFILEGCRRLQPSSFEHVRAARWLRGALIDTNIIPKPYKGALFPNDNWGDKEIMPEIMNGCGSAPVMRVDLTDSLREAGVDNLQLFDAEITDPDNGKVYTNYKVVNIVGCIKAADLSKSEYTQHGNGPVIDVDFNKLIIDEKKPRGTLMFRLAESVNVILVHKSVRDHLLAKKFPFLRFYEPEQVAT